jgi:D-alanine-D-alanine ligase
MENIFKTPINQMGLVIAGSLLEPIIKKLYEELNKVGIEFRPATYLSDSWGCPDRVPVIGIPFYLTNEDLWQIEKEKMTTQLAAGKIAEDAEEVLQILRHETGHAFNYAYELYKLPKWQETFGIFERPYEENFAPIASSDKFVRHLEGWYAQKHPDEDFAETFAVAITPDFDWKKVYKGTGAYDKLAYVSELIKEYKNQPVPAFGGELDVPIETLNMTLEEWYQKRLADVKPGLKALILFYQEYPKKRPVHDEVVDQVKEVLLGLNYSVVLLPVNKSLDKMINGIQQEKPDFIFNLCETFRDNDKFEFNVTARLEMIRVPFTGSRSGGIFLSHDKSISKKIFDFHKINYANFSVAPIGQTPELPKNLAYPLFVKPVHEDASIGISENSIVENEEDLKTKVKEIHEVIKDDALIEKYIDGREFFVSVLGNNLIKPLEVIELDFSKWPKDKPKIYTYKAKIEEDSEEFRAIGLKIPDDLTPEIRSKIQDVALKTYRALEARDYARVDIRMDADGKFYVLEANLNPYLAKNSETNLAAQHSGITYQQLIAQIVELTLARSGKH